MLRFRFAYLAAFLLGTGSMFLAGASGAVGQEKNDVLLRKAEALTADDAKDTKMRASYSKIYTFKMTEGKAYRIDLSSTDFDTYLRLLNMAGKELAFNDDIDTQNNNLNSRLVFVAPKTDDYKLVVTTFVAGKTGDFVLEVKMASKEEAVAAAAEAAKLAKMEKEAAIMRPKLARLAIATPAEQKKMIQEITKTIQDKGRELSIIDAQAAAQIASSIDESDPKFALDTIETFSKLFANGTDQQLSSQIRSMLKGEAKKIGMLGKELEIVGKTVDGKDFNLKDLKGKIVLVDFWATWCGPCIQEMPNIMREHKKYNEKGFQVIGVSLDRNDDAITKFVEDRKVPWSSINVEDSRKLADKYQVNAIPAPFLVGRDGRVISARARGPLLAKQLEKLFDEKN